MTTSGGIFLTQSLENILKERQVNRSAHAAIKENCESSLAELRDLENGNISKFKSFDRFFPVLHLCCKSKIVKVQAIALDCIQKLIAYGHLEGKTPSTLNEQDQYDIHHFGNSKTRLLADDVVKAICFCYVDSEYNDENVTLQVIKALLTAVTSTIFEVHGASLVNAMRKCYNISLDSSSLVNTATAKAALVQILNIVFQRMENQKDNKNEEIDKRETFANGHKDYSKDKTEEHVVTRAKENNGEEKQKGMEEVGAQEQDQKNCETDKENDDKQMHLLYDSVMSMDAYLLFKSLSKLSASDLVNQDTKSREYRSKILSLELVLAVLQEAGPMMSSNPNFITCIKQHLCIGLTNHAVSSVLHIFELSLAIFLALLKTFKKNLKAQIEVFFRDIFLLILESPTSTDRLKWCVLQALHYIVSDPKLLVEIYINYDCDLSMDNIFLRLVNDLSSLCIGKENEVRLNNAHRESVRSKSLECIFGCVSSMVTWMRLVSEAENMLENNNDHCSTEKIEVSDTVEEFEYLKRHKEVVEKGIEMFNSKKPKRGIAFLQEEGLLGQSVQDVAEWFRTEGRLSKTKIGECLGENDEESINIMKAYVDSYDFAGVELVDAIRMFLGNFRLCGEAQKIDRIMEKFACRFFENNLGYCDFASADTAYVLSYSIIMLTTDQHSVHVHKKMTKDEFIRNNRQINDGEDLDRKLLESIFDKIQAEEIKVKEDNHDLSKSSIVNTHLLNDEQKEILFHQQRSLMKETAQGFMSAQTNNNEVLFISAKHFGHVRPMFLSCWELFLNSLSFHLTIKDDEMIVNQCLDGFTDAVKICCVFDLTKEMEAFVSALGSFTGLLGGHCKNLRKKNVLCIVTLMEIASDSHYYLRGSWYTIMACISRLQILQTSDFADLNDLFEDEKKRNRLSHNSRNNDGGKENDIVGKTSSLANAASLDRRNSSSVIGNIFSRGKDITEFKKVVSDSSSQSVVLAVDRIFSGSTDLSLESIVDLLRALSLVTLEELQLTPPRMYMLQKLVEISSYNSNRIRMEWTKIWKELGSFFNKVVCMGNLEVVLFALDSLRQLATELLNREELDHYHFQVDFLQPFEYAMINENENHDLEIKDMNVRCLGQIIEKQGKHLRSGWKRIFFVFSLAAVSNSSSLVDLSFQYVISIVNEHVGPVFENAGGEFVNCVVEFALNSKVPHINMDAIDLLRRSLIDENIEENGKSIAGIIHVIMGVHHIIMSDYTSEITARATALLFDIMKNKGQLLPSKDFATMFSVLCRIFVDEKVPADPVKRKQWLSMTCTLSLCQASDIFLGHFDGSNGESLPELLKCVQWCITQNHRVLANCGIDVLDDLLKSPKSTKFSDENWKDIAKSFSSIFFASLPSILFWNDYQEGQLDEKQLNYKTQLLSRLLLLLKEILLRRFPTEYSDSSTPNSSLPLESVCAFLDIVKDGNIYFQKYNDNKTMRNQLYKKLKFKKNFIAQETETYKISIMILFRALQDETLGPSQMEIEERLQTVNKNVIERFMSIESEKGRQHWYPMLILVLSHLAALDGEKFRVQVSPIYGLMSELMSVNLLPEVKTEVRKIFDRVGLQLLKTS